MKENWPPKFTLDQANILNLLTGDRFYSNPSAALREVILNAIDAVHRRQKENTKTTAAIEVVFNSEKLTLTVTDNGVGMDEDDISSLFAKVGASAAEKESKKNSVGEFGIGVISYFMAGEKFDLHTCKENKPPISLQFSRDMLAGGQSELLNPAQPQTGTTITIHVRDTATFNLLLENFPYWCRDVDGLKAQLYPANTEVRQGGVIRAESGINVDHPDWVERVHLGPVSSFKGWESMTGISNISVLYRGVFVQNFEMRDTWGIEGSIDVDPKHFKPRLNREGFIEGQFQSEVEQFLREVHPPILQVMAEKLSAAMSSGSLDKWDEKRWAGLWLSLPRTPNYANAIAVWDSVFRKLPAFELAKGQKWQGISIEELKELGPQIYVAPLAEEQANDVVKAALHYLRSTGQTVIRGIKREKPWLRFAPISYGTTAELISSVFSDELAPFNHVSKVAEELLGNLKPIAVLYSGPPNIVLVRLGRESSPAFKLQKRLVINVDNPNGRALALAAIKQNAGAGQLIALTAQHAYQQLSEVASVVRESLDHPEVLSPVRKRFIQSLLA